MSTPTTPPAAPAPATVSTAQTGPAPHDFDLVLVATPWYPTPQNPMWGTFVRDAVVAMSMHHQGRITVVHVDGNPLYEGEQPRQPAEPAGERTEQESQESQESVRVTRGRKVARKSA